MRHASAEAWQRFLQDRQLATRLARKWASYARPTVRLVPAETLDDDNLPRGCSKLGGEPDLPAGHGWPTRPAYGYDRSQSEHLPGSAWSGQPLHFVGQIDLRDAETAGHDLPLPETGLLLFFYDFDVQPWGFDPHDAPGWRVIHVDEQTATERPQSPSGHSSGVRRVRCEPAESLPGWEWLVHEFDDDFGCSFEWFSAEHDKLTDGDWAHLSWMGHAFGGWPSLIQTPMELNCEMASNGVHVGRATEDTDPRMPEFRQRARDWRLLLQVGSDDELDWMLGDGGMAYVMCRESDIAGREFERVWTVLLSGWPRRDRLAHRSVREQDPDFADQPVGAAGGRAFRAPAAHPRDRATLATPC